MGSELWVGSCPRVRLRLTRGYRKCDPYGVDSLAAGAPAEKHRMKSSPPPAARQNPPRRDAMNRVSPARGRAPHRHPSPRCVGRGEFPRRRPPRPQEGREALCAIWQTVKADSDRRPPSSEFSTPSCGRATDPSLGSPSPSHRSVDPRDGNTHPRPHSNGKTSPKCAI